MNFQASLSSLYGSQVAINTVAQNLANANTPGYHRQRVLFSTRKPQLIGNHFLGAGVAVQSIDRIRDRVVEASYTNSLSDLAQIKQQLSVESQIESLFLPGEGSLNASIGGFFDEMARLATSPHELVQRNTVIQQGVNIAQKSRDISQQLSSLRQNTLHQLQIEVDTLNKEIESLVNIQKRISVTRNEGASNEILDQRDQLVNSIASKIDIQRYESVQDGLGLSLASSSFSVSVVPIRFTTHIDDQGTVSVLVEGTDQKIKLASGSLGALAEVYNKTIPEFQKRIDTFARDLIRNINQEHAKGVGISGSFSFLRSTQIPQDVTVPLDQAGLAFPPQAGSLAITVTDPQGDKRTFPVAIDPSTDSLNDIADRISLIDNLQAVVEPQTGTMSLIAASGYHFDFTGSVETIPGLASYTGTSVPSFSGAYQGETNRELSVVMIGSGTVGKTPGLAAQVTDVATGKVIANLDLGENYEAGTDLDVIDGVSFRFSGGEVVDGDQFNTPLIHNSDTSGILSALGLNNFFSGSGASNIDVAARIQDDPQQLASSRSGDIADTTNSAAIVNLRDQHLMDNGRVSFEDFLEETNSNIGIRVQASVSVQTNVMELSTRYEQEIASVSGIDLNEELLSLTNFQKTYEASTRVIRTIDAMFDELFAVIR